MAGAGKPREHDIDLYNRISGIMDDDALTFLQQHDFNMDFQQSRTEPMSKIANWHGARYEFLDAGLQKKWKLVREQIDGLAGQYVAKLVPRSTGQGMLTAHLLGYERHNQPAHAVAEVQELNRTATKLYEDYNQFDRYARRRLGL
ncbi:MAG: hypothetical protein B7Z08_04845 [Sphingomonadales bacterium 32-68-7]|nr:MAG: hypothetical protein B7Z08_04845 [Sphingomonadales bacterium 32-68-7]